MNGAERARTRMVARQLGRRGISDERVLAAMERVPREAFVPVELAGHAYDDAALPIGDGQTISQPYIVAAMCELLTLDGTETVLDIGTGSGYAAAVLDELAAAVVSIEVVPALAERARAALAATGHERVEVRVGDGREGAPDRAPFEAIAVAAATDALPPTLVDQLATRGRLVAPLGGRGGQRLVRLLKTDDGLAETWSVACRFVPLVRV
jgi:protein-L-isoaspartate(D-aspartate) O-methyltransferase